MRYLDTTGFKEGFLEFDRATRAVLDELTGVLEDVAQQGPYGATPLLLMAVLVEGGLGGTLAALLQGKSLAELARRGALFYQLLQLVRAAAQLPDAAQLLARPVRLGAVQASALGCLASLAEGPAARLLLDCDHLTSRPAAASLLTASRGDEPQRQLQIKMARKVRDTHALLASAIETAVARASAAASAALPAPPEAQQLESLIRELQAARVGVRAGGGEHGAWASEGVGGASSTHPSRSAAATAAPSSAMGDGGGGGSYHGGYHGGYQQLHTGGVGGGTAGATGGQYTYGSAGSYGHAPAQPASLEHIYGLTSPPAAAAQQHASARPGYAAQAGSGSASGRSWDYSEGAGAGAGAADAAAVEEAVIALRVHREMQRLQAAKEAAVAARTPGEGGGGTILGVVGAGFARDAWGHRSQPQLAAPPYGGNPLLSSTATLTYPWQREYVELYGGSGAAAGSGGSSSSQQPTQAEVGRQAGPAAPQHAWPAEHYHAPPSAYGAAYESDTRSAGLDAAGDPPVAATAAAAVAAPAGQHLGGYSALAGSGDFTAARARLVACSSGGSGANGSGWGYAGQNNGSTAAAGAQPAAAAAATSGGRPGSAVRLHRQEAPSSTIPAATTLLAGTAAAVADDGAALLQAHRIRRGHEPHQAAARSSSRPRTYGQADAYSATSPQPARARDPSSSVTWLELEAAGQEPAAAAAAATWPRGAVSSAADRPTSTSRVRIVTQPAQEPLPPPYDRLSLRRQPASRTSDTSGAETVGRPHARPAAPAPAAAGRPNLVSSADPDAGRAYSRARGGGGLGASSNNAEPGTTTSVPASHASPSPSPHRHRHVSSEQLAADTDRALELYDEAQLQRAIQLSKQEAARAALAAAGVAGLAGSRDQNRDAPSASPGPSPRPSSSLRDSSPLLHHRSRSGGVTPPRRAAGDPGAAAAPAIGGAAAAEAAHAGRPGSASTPRRRLGDQDAAAVAAASRSTEVQAPAESQAAQAEQPGSMLVSAIVPLTTLHQRYADLLPLLCAKLVSLEDDFPATRRVAGDGNCFYRAALFGLLEHVLAAPDPKLAERLDLVVSRHLARLDEPQFQQQQQQQQHPSPGPASDGRGAGVSPLRSARGDPAGTLAPASPGQPGEGAAAAHIPPRDDPAAYRGGQRLLRLLRTAWFKCPDAPRPSDVSSLERLFNSAEQSGEVIRFARSLTARELMAAEDFYTPFIPGCGGDYAGLSLRQICERHVLPMGVEVEQLQIIAACTALGVTLAVLDVAGSAVGAIKHGPAAQQHGPPVAWVAHLPGHYDVIYPARALDVAPGGQLVAVDM
ncbi:hypothetical protein HXX76_011049 [Chlamydomonas incerta]|uniref:OTU domain-containing protein n=1 Tax=Chlamydomonas incerta TaxID=51695 RepID=A0A835VY32_CHLIN|nr:hypothetical protein HXX76_011049 [Chlamydomonas incerta]|eukprot:KAG2429281.1 hypothetical protein HXX76_011049 [Chlamydomonas incerta]